MAVPRKVMGVIAVIAVAAALIVAAVALGVGSRASVNNSNDSARPQVDDVLMSGTGNGVSERFTLEEGVMVLHITYVGSSFFVANLYKETGYLWGMLVNEKGPFEGSTLVGVKNGSTDTATPGKYFLKVEAAGAWNLTIEQPRVNEGSELPITISGRGTNVSFPIDLANGSVTFNMTHVGRSNFAVKLWADDGTYIDLLASELGNYTGEKIIRVSDMIGGATPWIYWLSINADGEWTITVTSA